VWLWVVVSLKLVLEVGLLSWLAQGLVGLLAGARREANPFWRLLSWVVAPWLRLTRWLGRGRLSGPAAYRLTGALLALLWLGVTALKITWCLRQGVASCR
jgi:hypothetical protein